MKKVIAEEVPFCDECGERIHAPSVPRVCDHPNCGKEFHYDCGIHVNVQSGKIDIVEELRIFCRTHGQPFLDLLALFASPMPVWTFR